jgi:hypothetical protein
MGVKLWKNYHLVASGHMKTEGKNYAKSQFNALQDLNNKYNLHDFVVDGVSAWPASKNSNDKSVKDLMKGVKDGPDVVIIAGIHNSGDGEHVSIQLSEASTLVCHLYVSCADGKYAVDYPRTPDFRHSPRSRKAGPFIDAVRP